MRASLITIGSELLAGDTINTNAAWLGQQLLELGATLETVVTVDDDINVIVEALQFATRNSGTEVFISGGLGPTSDDVTRDAVAKFVGRSLRYDEPSWQRLYSLLSSHNVPVAETNRRQCFFPEGATILQNDVGTAAGFRVPYGKGNVWVLPGPPRELHHIWQVHIEAVLRSVVNSKRRVRKWHCLGISESLLAQRIEALSIENLTIAYQSHPPFIRIKAFYTDGSTGSSSDLSRLSNELKDWVFFEDEADPCRLLAASLSTATMIIDSVSCGYLQKRLSECQVGDESTMGFLNIVGEAHSLADMERFLTPPIERLLILDHFDSQNYTFDVKLRGGGIDQEQTLRLPHPNLRLPGRNLMVAAELAVKSWSAMLTQRV